MILDTILRAARDAAVAALAPPLQPEPDTAGGDHDAEPSAWDGGRYRGATQSPIHRGRVGGAIRPWLVVVHTTDMLPSTWPGLLRRLAREPGRGAAAHFWLGRDPGQGLHQLVDIGRNANHAGGTPAHGWLDVRGHRAHPNTCAVGIEVHCAGNVIQRGGLWRAWKREDVDGDGDRDLVPIGPPLPPEDVEPDPAHPGRGWHRPTAYQLRELELLLRALGDCSVMVAPPPTSQWSVVPNGPQHLPPWAPSVVIGGVPVIGHTTIDPARKSDPGPVLSRWLAGLR